MYLYLSFLTLLVNLAVCDKLRVIIAESDECKEDFQAMKDECAYHERLKGNGMSNLLALECLQNPPENTRLSDKCDHYLWKFKMNLTEGGFIPQVSSACQQEINQLRLCEEDKHTPGHFLSCLVENKHNTRNIGCRKTLTRIETIIFSDFRLVSKFLHACVDDVEKNGCGRIAQSENDPHSQGKTIACLEEKIDTVDDKCKNEILQIAEMQGENVHLDRVLDAACREDMNRFCNNLLNKPTNGEIYDCLLVNKGRPEMSDQCKHEISRRQRLTSMDYRVSQGLVNACKNDIKATNCRPGQFQNEHVGLSHILVCLTEAALEGAVISGPCTNEMEEYRRSLMEDYSVTPELVKDCYADVRKYCPNVGKGGKTIHCLMEASMDNVEKGLSPVCQKTFDNFVREIQVELDWSADPVLEEACVDVVVAACDPKTGKEGVMSCLMENMARDSKAMTGECRKVLMQIQYFLSREVVIDRDLYNKCRGDAKRLCDSGDDWHHEGMREVSSHLVFPCLVRNLYLKEFDDDDSEDHSNDQEKNEVVSKSCSEEVGRVLRMRAFSVKLMPNVERECRDFLHLHCTLHTGLGEEFTCLQDNLDVLPPNCREKVVEMTELQAHFPYLHPNILKGCQRTIDENCGMEHETRDGHGVMECLKRHLVDNPPGSPDSMDDKCQKVVETWQILEIKDFHFSIEFKTACKSDIRHYCKGITTKFDIVHCLEAKVIDDTVNDNPHKINKKCRDSLKFELLQKHSNLKLDPLLSSACGNDMALLCPTKQGLEAVECLKEKPHSEVSKGCRKVLFEEEEEEAINNQVDFPLMRNCKKEIKQHCSNANASGIINCLAEFSQDFDFDEKCLRVLKKRIAQHSKDYRLNTDLTRACRQDIKKYCRDIVRENNGKDSFYEGKVLFCLKDKYSQNVNLLTRSCTKQMQRMIRNTYNSALDPQIEEKCPKMIEKCSVGINKNEVGDEEVMVEHECLVKMWTSGDVPDGEECANALAVTAESQMRDVKSDRVLFKSCSLDLAKFCREVSSGEGKKFACLVNIYKDKNFRLEPKCEEIVSSRMAMYKVAIKAHPIEQAMELFDTVMASPDRHYFLSFFGAVVLTIFVLGLCFGRVTKRVRSEMKNR